ncbi:hypothetical protein GC197_14205 [bacterium]|nr:hypothetical protein [bacterium]
MRQEGRAIWFLCEGDGSFSVRVFVDEEPSAQLRPFLEDEEVYPDVFVKGETYFGGMEFMIPEDEEPASEVPGMCSKLDIPNGVYLGTIYRTKIPPAFSREWLRNRMGAGAYRVLHWQQLLSKATMMGVIGVLLASFFLQWFALLAAIILVGITFILAVLLSKSESCQAAIVAIDEFTEEFPEYVVVLSSHSADKDDAPDSTHLAMPVG